MNKVLFTNCSFSDEEIEKLKSKEIDIKKAGADLSEEELISELQGCKGYVMGGSDKASDKVIKATDLGVIIFYGTGYENYIDVPVANEKNVAVANTPQANAYTVAEHTVALILAAVKNIAWLNTTTKNGEWNRRITWNLEGKTLGVFGFGAIGGSVARIMHKAFNMNVLYANRSAKPELEKELGAKKVELSELFSKSDVVCIHTPYNKETENIVGDKELRLMQKHAVLVNAARAEIVNPKALRGALTEGVFATAVFDTYYKEPSPRIEDDQFGLLSLDDNKFVITPHTAYGSKEAFQKMNDMVIENLITFFESGSPKYKVN